MIKTSVDYETFSELDVMKVGAWAYSRHPSTEVLFLSWADDDESPSLSDNVERIKQEIIERRDNGNLFSAFNSFFEYCITLNTLGIDPGPISQWQDTAAQAAALALPRSLDAVGKALGMPQDLRKDQQGKKLIQALCKPVRGKRNRDFKMLRELGEYCRQDVIAERAIANKLRPLSAHERKIWELDQTINLRGVPFDIENVEHARAIRDKEKEKLLASVDGITDGQLANINSRPQLMAYCEANGYKLKNTQKEYLADVLEDKTLPEKVKQVVEIRTQTSKTSIAKYDSLTKIVDMKDSRARGLLRYHGASTGRWSGNLFQPQNLTRPTLKDPESAVELFKFEDNEMLEMIYGSTMETLSSCVRSMIQAEEGKRLLVCDFSAIEARVLAWLAGQQNVVNAFANGEEVYKLQASEIYRKKVVDITQAERDIGKVAVLALGYQGAVGAFQQMAKTYGVKVPNAFAQKVVDAFRDSNKRIVSFWYDLDRAAKGAVKHPGKVYKCRGIKFKCANSFLFCRLPSGRFLAYYRPRMKEGKFGTPQIHYLGVNSKTKHFGELDTYGGKLAENITQAVARDLMAEGMLRVEPKGYEIIMTVHDEIIAEVDTDFGSLEEYKSLMCELPVWAEGLPLDGDGYEAKRYKK